ncbi:DUF6221 family protein [Cryptosporangium sp. NPDC048952]|uniref:DUF6221 family protein n=1 Tax=Cryptosporangium sp. NPDC048952 TaxID=3363961 RepID=UPI003721AFD9
MSTEQMVEYIDGLWLDDPLTPARAGQATRTSQLVAFLRARFDEIEEIAQVAGGYGKHEIWTVCATGESPEDDDPGAWAWVETNPNHPNAPEDGMDPCPHMARHNPANVLRDLDAKRRIMDRAVEAITFSTLCGNGKDLLAGSALAHTHTLRALALPFDDHKDYDVVWRP